MPRKITTDEFVSRAQKMHGTRYDYSQVEYVSANHPVIIRCREHGEFQQRPSVHLRPAGCPRCGHQKVGAENSKRLIGKQQVRFLEPTKVCRSCRIEKPNDTEHFTVRRYKDGSTVTGSYCRECKRAETAKDSPLANSQREQRRLFKEGLRRCTRCRKTKAFDSFYLYNSGLYSTFCRECHGSGLIRDIKKLFRKGLIRCTSCGKELPANGDNFYPAKQTQTGFAHKCKPCTLSDLSPEYYAKIELAERGLKLCVSCGETKSIDGFIKGAGIGGTGSYCKPCAAAFQHLRVQATPSWLTQNQRGEIKRFYIEAAELSVALGVLHEVDHIVPIRGKAVCGLHVPWNLQVLPARENRRKGNKVQNDE